MFLKVSLERWAERCKGENWRSRKKVPKMIKTFIFRSRDAVRSFKIPAPSLGQALRLPTPIWHLNFSCTPFRSLQPWLCANDSWNEWTAHTNFLHQLNFSKIAKMYWCVLEIIQWEPTPSPQHPTVFWDTNEISCKLLKWTDACWNMLPIIQWEPTPSSQHPTVVWDVN